MGKRHVRVLPSRFGHHVAPELGALQHVRLVHGAELAATSHRQIECHFGDSPDLPLRVKNGVHTDPLALFDADAAGFSEVGIARELPDDHEIDVLDDVGLQGRGIDQIGMGDDGTQIREEPQFLPETQQRPFRPQVIGKRLPLRPSHGPEQHGIACPGKSQTRFRQGHPACIRCGPTDKPLAGLERDPRCFGDHRQTFQRFPNDLRTDPVAGKYRNSENLFVHHFLPCA